MSRAGYIINMAFAHLTGAESPFFIARKFFIEKGFTSAALVNYTEKEAAVRPHGRREL